jgi:hypothetical protein
MTPESRLTGVSDLLDISDQQVKLSHATEAVQALPTARLTPSQADLLLRYVSQMQTAIRRATAYGGLS